MAAFDFPNSPSNGQTYSANGIDWIYNGSVWKKDATSGVKGQKGEIGQKGQKGEVGEKGTKGEVGDKGQKGEIGATGGTGGTGTKGQKGESGVDATGTKGQKGEIGPQGGSGGTGSDGDKGQKGEIGSITAAIPSGGIIIWSGASNAIPSGWYLCNGSNGTPDLRNRFIIGAGSSYSVNATGGSADATLVSHSHTINNHTHSFSTNNQGSHVHNLLYNHGAFGGTSGAVTPRSGNTPVTPGISGRVSSEGGHTHSGTTGNPSNTGTNSQGSSANNANLPPYYALCYIMKS